MDQPARGFPQRGLAELPEDALLHILYHLPSDDRARVATLSRRFAAVVASPELGVRLILRCSTVHHLPSAVCARLISKATALTELDISQQHLSAGDAFSPLIMLSQAQRQQLTVLRCEPATALDAACACPRNAGDLRLRVLTSARLPQTWSQRWRNFQTCAPCTPT
jgi:hypothetical protein